MKHPEFALANILESRSGGPPIKSRGSIVTSCSISLPDGEEIRPPPHTSFHSIHNPHCRLKTPAAINLSVRGLPPVSSNRSSAVRICKLARIWVMIPITCLRPSSTVALVHFFAQFSPMGGVYNSSEIETAHGYSQGR